MKYVEYEASHKIVNDDLINKILDYNNIYDLDLLNKYSFPYDYEFYYEFIRLVDKHKNISIIGDYDCDGICATSIIYLFLKRLGKRVYYIIGNRATDGYGMNENLINNALNNESTLIITVDNGINSKKEVDYAKSKGLDVIVTDHHLLTDDAPDAPTFNPHYEDIKFMDVCGAFVALSLVYSYFKHKNSIDKDFLTSLYELAALATISDVMPLYDINRLIVSNLVKSINYNKVKNKGIKLLCDYLNILKEGPITATDLSFSVVPILNAAGRLDDASIVVDLFTGNESVALIEEIIRINDKRKQLTNSAYENLRQDDFKNNIPVCFIDDISEGLLGIISGKVLNITKKPTFVFTQANGIIKGSGRSLENFDLHSCVSNMDINYLTFGGHKRAIGISFDNLDDFKKFKNDIQKVTVPEAITYYINYNYESFQSVYKKLQSLEPIGEGLKIPYFYLESEITDIKILNNKHTSFRVKINNKYERFIVFNQTLDSGIYQMLFEIKNNSYGSQGQIFKIAKIEQ